MSVFWTHLHLFSNSFSPNPAKKYGKARVSPYLSASFSSVHWSDGPYSLSPSLVASVLTSPFFGFSLPSGFFPKGSFPSVPERQFVAKKEHRRCNQEELISDPASASPKPYSFLFSHLTWGGKFLPSCSLHPRDESPDVPERLCKQEGFLLHSCRRPVTESACSGLEKHISPLDFNFGTSYK